MGTRGDPDRPLAAHGEPVAYLFGEREFYGRPFVVDRRVLIPRPETEHLIETVLELDLPESPRVLDLGTGSGCIATTLALELPAARVTASDLSWAALAVARENVRRHQARVHLVRGDLLDTFRLGELDLIVSNPPYVAESERSGLSTEITGHEPEAALFAGEDGLDAYRGIFAQAARIRRGARLVLEIGASQADVLSRLAHRHQLDVAQKVRDHAGLDRILVLEPQ